MRAKVHRGVLKVYRRLPAWARRRIVRLLSPSFTVGATCLIERPDGAVLLVKQTYRQHWGLPGGLLQRGEDPVDGARREVLEEVGLVVETVGPPAAVVDAVPQRIDLVFRARPVRLSDLEQVGPRSPEIDEVAWFPQDQLPRLQFETADAIVALARSGSPSAYDVPLT
jgi:8-oxo-dGTP diphosphatase